MNRTRIPALLVMTALTAFAPRAHPDCETEIEPGAGRSALSAVLECLQQEIEGLQRSSSKQMIPIGGVVAWWGDWTDAASRPFGYELCDGTKVYTQSSPIYGQAKPNLHGRFVRGAESSNLDVLYSKKTGGTDRLANLRVRGTALTVRHLPKHAHKGSTVAQQGTHSHDTSGRSASDDGGQSSDNYFALGDHKDKRSWPGIKVTGGGHSHSLTIQTAGEGAPHYHDIPDIDIKPSFVELLYLIRVE